MNLKNLIKRTGMRMRFALSLLTVVIVTGSSCQKDNVSPKDANDFQITTPITPTSFASTAVVTCQISGPISLNGVKNITISGKSITGGKVPCISLTNCSNIIITHCKLINSTTTGVNLSNCVNISVDTSYISNVSTGVYATTCKTIKVVGNQMQNMVGPYPRGQFVQFNTVSGTGNRVINNICENIMGSSYPEDAISMYMTNGTAASPVMISGNWIKGGGPSKTGGGIILGDDGGSYQIAQNNILVNPGQYGIGVAGGTNMQILNNKIYAAQNTFTNVGVCVWNQYTNISASSGITVSGNNVNWTNSAGISNPCWNDGNCGTVTGWSNNTWGSAITSSILPATIITFNNWQTTPAPVTYKNSGPISLNGVSNMTISGESITGGNVPCISLTNCTNIIITHCKLINSTTTGVNLYNCVNISVDTSYISNVSTGVYASTCQGIKVAGNQMKNMVGPMPRGQFVQFNTVSGAGNMVINNRCENIMGSSHPEDAISMYMTNGTPASPVIISWNWIRGGGPSTTGGGINLGDDGGSYQIAENNILVNPGQYGMAVSGGTNMQLLNNVIYAAQNTFTNVGISVWNQYTNISASSGITVSGNQVNWTNSAGALNPDWNAGNCGTVTGWSNNTWGSAITSSILPATIITLN